MRVGVVAGVFDVAVAVLAGRGRVEGDALLVELAQGLLVVGVASLGGAPEHVLGLVPRPHAGRSPARAACVRYDSTQRV